MTQGTKERYALSEYRLISELKLWDKNPRSIKPERFEELKERLKRQGQIKPLLCTPDGTVIGGNMRLQGMEALGWEKAWVSVQDVHTDKEIFDLALTDNEEFGYYEEEQLAELALDLGLTPLELQAYEVSLGDTTTLDSLIDKFGPEVEEDEPPEVEEGGAAVTAPGTVYQLGRHRLMCGDATSEADVTCLMNGVKADMVFTDPPYNVAYEGKTKEALTIQNDSMGNEEFYKFLYDVHVNMAMVTKEGGAIYVCHADSEGLNFRKALLDAGFLLKQCLIWVKQSMVMGRQDYQWQHEPILYGWKDGGSHYFVDDRTQTTIWNINRPSRNEEHPTMKPLELCAKAIVNSSLRGGKVLDLFGGSGSTLMAAERTNRTCYMMELDPKYCDVIRKRYAKHIGKEEEWQESTPCISQQNPAPA